MEPQRLFGQPMYTDDHCGPCVCIFEQPAPLRYSLTVTGEHDCLGRVRWNVNRDLPSTVVLERLGDKLSRDCAGGLGGRPVGLAWLAVDVIACLFLHGLAFILEPWHSDTLIVNGVNAAIFLLKERDISRGVQA